MQGPGTTVAKRIRKAMVAGFHLTGPSAGSTEYE